MPMSWLTNITRVFRVSFSEFSRPHNLTSLWKHPGSVLKTLKDLKRDLLSDLPRREKTPPPDPVEIERRLLQETIDEVAGLGPATEENELIEEPMIDVYEEAKRRGIQLPEHLAQPYPAQQSLLDPSMHRENGVNSFDQNLLNVGPAAGSVENSVELPEATVDEIADMGHFAGVGGLKLFNTMVARERISNNEIRESVRQRQAAKPLQLVSNPLVILENSLALDLDASMPNLADPQTLAAPRETLIGSAVQLPDLPEVQMVDQEPLPTPTNTIAEVLVPAAQEKQKKRRRKPRKQRSPSPEEYVEFPELHRELIRHKHKPRKMRQNQPQVRALAYPMIDIFDGIKDYGLDCAYLSSDDDSPILQTPGPAPEVPEAADIPEFMIPDEEPQMIQVQASTPPLETDSPQEDHASKRPRFDTIASILSPNASLIPGIRDISSLKPNGKRFTTDDIAYSYLNEKSQQALMTSEEKAMTRDELLLHKVRQAEKQELAKKAASSGASKAAEPGPEVLYQKFQGKGETMVRFVGLNGKIEKLPEYAIETVSVYLQIRMFMAKNQWRMEWDNIWENFEIPEKVTTKKMLEMRLYYLNDKGLIFLHLDDDGAILEVEIKVKPKTAEEKRAKQAQKN